jgi:hypothetical protein
MEDSSSSPVGAGMTAADTFLSNTNSSSMLGPNSNSSGIKHHQGGAFNNTQPLSNISAIYLQNP